MAWFRGRLNPQSGEKSPLTAYFFRQGRKKSLLDFGSKPKMTTFALPKKFGSWLEYVR
jgi:hypothetical protein